MEQEQKIIDFLKNLIKEIFGYDIEVKLFNDSMGTNAQIITDPLALGDIVGKRGEHIQSIRTLTKIWGRRNKININVWIPSKKPENIRSYDPKEINSNQYV